MQPLRQHLPNGCGKLQGGAIELSFRLVNDCRTDL